MSSIETVQPLPTRFAAADTCQPGDRLIAIDRETGRCHQLIVAEVHVWHGHRSALSLEILSNGSAVQACLDIYRAIDDADPMSAEMQLSCDSWGGDWENQLRGLYRA